MQFYFQYFGDWDQWPDLDKLSPEQAGVSDIDFDIDDHAINPL